MSLNKRHGCYRLAIMPSISSQMKIYHSDVNVPHKKALATKIIETLRLTFTGLGHQPLKERT